MYMVAEVCIPAFRSQNIALHILHVFLPSISESAFLEKEKKKCQALAFMLNILVGNRDKSFPTR